MERVSVAQAAKELDMTPLTVRILMQQKQMDIGYVMTGKNGCHMVTGLYFKRRSPFTPVLYSELDEPGIDENGKPVPHVTEYVDYPHDTIFPVKGCGFGCVLMTTKLLRDVWENYGPAFSPYPWASEDISFCHRVNQLGYTIYCDSRVSCGHIGTFVYTEDNVQGKKVEK